METFIKNKIKLQGKIDLRITALPLILLLVVELSSYRASAQSINGQTSICVGQSAGYTFSGPAGSSVTGWQVIGGSATGSGTSVTINWTAATNVGKVTVTYTVAGEAQSPATLSVVVFPSGGTLTAGTISAPSSVCYNATATISNSSGAGGGGFARYFWWKRGVSEASFTQIDGVIGDAYSTNSLTESTYFYRMASFQCGQISSNTVYVSVFPLLSPGSISQPAPLCNASPTGYLYGASPATGGTGTYSYQWQRSNDAATWSDVTGSTDPAGVSTGNLTGTTWFRRKVTSCTVSYSNIVSVSIFPPLTPGALSGTTTVCSGGGATFTGTPAGGGNGSYTYQWYIQNDIGGWDPISGANGLNYAVTSTGVTHRFKRIDTSCNDARSTNTVAIFINEFSVPGVINPPSTEVCTKFSGPLNIINSLGGVLRWEKNTGAGWQVIPSSNSTTLNLVDVVDLNTQFKAILKNGVCPQVETPVATLKVYRPTATINGTSAFTYGGVTLMEVGSYSSYRWFKDDIELTQFSTTPTALYINEPGTYKAEVKATPTSPSCVTNTVTVKGLSGQVSVNYKSVTRFRVAGISPFTNVYKSPTPNYTQSIQYQDGLGRPIQQVGVRQAPGTQEIIQPMSYDRFGKNSTTFLSYSLEISDGLFRPYALKGTTGDYSNAEQRNFYTNSIALKRAEDPNPYAVTLYDNSPVGRVLKQGAPGTDWQPTADPLSLADRTVKNQYAFNTTSEVLLFTYNAADGSVSATTGTQPLYYSANQLFKNVTYDENNNQVVVFTDKEGKTILKKVQYGKDAGNNPLFGSTYYVYDDLGRLAVVLPPEAINSMGSMFTQN